MCPHWATFRSFAELAERVDPQDRSGGSSSLTARCCSMPAEALHVIDTTGKALRGVPLAACPPVLLLGGPVLAGKPPVAPERQASRRLKSAAPWVFSDRA